MSKNTTGYFIEEENKKWIAKKGKEIRRSASWYLNELLTRLRIEENNSETH